MDDIHITPELLTALHRLELPPEFLLRLGWDHLQAVCPNCRAGIESWLGERRVGGVYDGAFAKAEGVVTALDASVAAERPRVARDLREIVGLDPGEALRRVRVARKRFRDASLVQGLLEEAESHLHGDPRRSLELLACARAVVERPGEEAEPGLRLRVLLHRANAQRAAGALGDSRHSFEAARRFLADHPLVPYDLYALIARFEGGLMRDRGELEEALRLLSLALLIYRVFGDERAAAKVRLKLANVHFRRGEAEESAVAIQQALEVFDTEKDLKLVAITRQILASYHCDSGDPTSARSVVEQSRPIFDRYVASSQAESFRLLVVWLDGKIARGLEEYGRAEELLLEAAEGFSALENSHEMALVLLDLADSYLVAGDGAGVRGLVPRIEPLLSAHDLEQPILAALLLFQNSIRQELVSRSTVTLVRRRIQREGGCRPEPSERLS